MIWGLVGRNLSLSLVMGRALDLGLTGTMWALLGFELEHHRSLHSNLCVWLTVLVFGPQIVNNHLCVT